MQPAALGAVALVYKDEQLAHHPVGTILELLDKVLKVVHIPLAELVSGTSKRLNSTCPP